MYTGYQIVLLNTIMTTMNFSSNWMRDCSLLFNPWFWLAHWYKQGFQSKIKHWMANSLDPYERAISSGFILFAQVLILICWAERVKSGHVHCCKLNVFNKSTKNGNKCWSRWDGFLQAVSSGSTLFAKFVLDWTVLTFVLLNPDIPCHCKQCRSRSNGFWRSQLIWICTVCH